MTKYPFKLLVFSDSQANETRLKEGLKQLKEEFKVGWNGQIVLEPEIFKRRLGELDWQKYSAPSGGDESWGPDLTRIVKDTNALWKNFGTRFTSVLYHFARQNWDERTDYGGWNLGMYGNYGVQIMKQQHTPEWEYKLMLHEVMHVFDDLYAHDMGKDINKYLGYNYDQDPEKGVHHTDSDGNYIYEFRDLMRDIKPYVMSNITYRDPNFREWQYREKWKDRARISLNNWIGKYKRRHPIVEPQE